MRYWPHGTAHAVRHHPRWRSHRVRDGRQGVAADRARAEPAVCAQPARVEPGKRVLRSTRRELDCRPVRSARDRAFRPQCAGLFAGDAAAGPRGRRGEAWSRPVRAARDRLGRAACRQLCHTEPGPRKPFDLGRHAGADRGLLQHPADARAGPADDGVGGVPGVPGVHDLWRREGGRPADREVPRRLCHAGNAAIDLRRSAARRRHGASVAVEHAYADRPALGRLTTVSGIGPRHGGSHSRRAARDAGRDAGGRPREADRRDRRSAGDGN